MSMNEDQMTVDG